MRKTRIKATVPALAVLAGAACEPAPPQTPSPAAVTTAERRAPETNPAFRAVGQEPGWLLTIVPGRWIDFLYDYGESRVRTPVPEPAGEGGMMSYHAVTEAHELFVAIEDSVCADAMSGEEYPLTVTVELDGRSFAGCGESLIAAVEPGRYCYSRRTTPPRGGAAGTDVLALSVEVGDLWAEGSYDWLPAEKDARRGTFEGVLDRDTVQAVYTFEQEGRRDETTLSIRLRPGEATVSGGAPELGLSAMLPATECP